MSIIWVFGKFANMVQQNGGLGSRKSYCINIPIHVATLFSRCHGSHCYIHYISKYFQKPKYLTFFKALFEAFFKFLSSQTVQYYSIENIWSLSIDNCHLWFKSFDISYNWVLNSHIIRKKISPVPCLVPGLVLDLCTPSTPTSNTYWRVYYHWLSKNPKLKIFFKEL